VTTLLRRAGRGRLPGGAEVVWSVAEGERGRRWRWTVRRPDGLVTAGLVERAPDGAFRRLELATASGLLSLHPEPDSRSAHGNAVLDDGVRPIALPWEPGWGIAIRGDAFGTAVTGWDGRGVVLDPDLLTVQPALEAADEPILPLDPRGVPTLTEPAEWPLEESGSPAPPE
jgi:hypothetical protein